MENNQKNNKKATHEYSIPDYDMQYFYDNFAHKLDSLLAHKYNNLKDHKWRSSFLKDYESKIGSPLKKNTVDSWYRKDKNTIPKIDTLINLCVFFDCDIDYFFRDQVHFSNDNEMAASVTGLDCFTVERIKTMSESDKHLIDALFGVTDNGTDIIRLFREVIFYGHPKIKRNTNIVLDDYLTTLDEDYEHLEHELNQKDTVEILSLKVSYEILHIIENLMQNHNLSNEIMSEYKSKNYKKSLRILSTNMLPKLGNPQKNIEDMERKVIERYSERDKLKQKHDYHDSNIPNTFSELKKEMKKNKSNDNYEIWLNHILINTL